MTLTSPKKQDNESKEADQQSGIQRTFGKLANKFFFSYMFEKIKKYIQSCDLCQKYKTQNRTHSQLNPFSRDTYEGCSKSFASLGITRVVATLSRRAGAHIFSEGIISRYTKFGSDRSSFTRFLKKLPWQRYPRVSPNPTYAPSSSFLR